MDVLDEAIARAAASMRPRHKAAENPTVLFELAWLVVVLQ